MSANRILIVDDEEIIVRLLSMSLRSDGYETLAAHSGEEGLKVFQESDPDIVVTDIKMPGMDGLELLKKIKELDPDKEVIIVTGHGDIDSTITALQYGASDFINKPVRDEALAIALDRAKEKISIREKLEEYTKNLEEKVAEATREIRRKSDFQQLLIHSSHDAIVAFNSNWEVVVYNPVAARMFDQAPGQVMKRTDIDGLYTEDLAKMMKAKADESLAEGEVTMPWKEMVLETKDNRQVPVRFAASFLHEKGEFVGTVNFFQDLTRIKELERDLVQSERLAAVGQTVSGLAHYVKNILIGLKGGSYVVAVGLQKNDTEKLKTGWNTIKKNIRRVADLTQDLLTYSKERKPEPEACVPNEIVEEVVALVKDVAASKDIELITELDPALESVVLDPGTLHRCLLNLINNAMDACLEDEDVSKAFAVRITTRKPPGDEIVISVADNGCGMDEETQTQLFTPMFSSKGGKGTGLGLLVTQKLVEEHRGSIQVDTREGQGSEFFIKLPFETADAADINTTEEEM